jgi:hypothetical protein
MAGVEQDVRAATINGMTRDELLDTITAHYLKDNEEFNGLRVASTGLTDTELKAVLRQLVAEELGSLHLGPHPNPYIKAFPAHPPGAQLAALDQLDDLAHLVVYPERRHLEQVVDPDAYAGRPYTLRMALGDPQLAPVFFDLSVLERYRNDPRYHYWTDDLSGLISVTDEHYETGTMSESDQVLLQSFGYGYDDAFHRAVCVFLRYLSPLTPAHQQIWKAGELGEGYKLHPAYFDAVRGEFPEAESIFNAFLEELSQLQRMSEAAGLPPLVRETFQDGKPSNFTFLIRPTLKELQDFHATLDKLMSENLNKRFFAEFEVELTTETERSDGKLVVTSRGTIAVLEEWLWQLQFAERDAIDETIKTFREVRKLRQRPAHAADDNAFDLTYYEQQRELVIRAYRAVRTLRGALATHPALKDYDGVPDWLRKGKIYTC